MKKNLRTGQRLFFLEFLIVLFFFLIISTVCLRIFAGAHRISERTEVLSHANLAAVSVLEALDASGGSKAEAAKAFPCAHLTEDGFELAYAADFSSCDASDAAWLLCVSLQEENRDITASVTVSDAADQSILFELSGMIHRPFSKQEVLS